MGINPALFDDVMTSGLECHTMLRERVHPFHGTLGLNLFHIGPERDRTVFDTLPYVCVESIAAADFLLITGTDGWEETADAYHDRLQAALDCGLPALCANADKTVFIGNSQVICAGAIAEVYRTMIRATNGGANEAEKLYIHGKPDAGLFKAAHDLANARRGAFTPKSRLLMLGDSLATDIKGANNYGIDSVLAFSGVHKDTSRSDIGVLFDSYQAIPSYVMEQIG
jgi:HAD superfamily hydrolase (TIGR01459 family)